jgi:hypothetical protein
VALPRCSDDFQVALMMIEGFRENTPGVSHAQLIVAVDGALRPCVRESEKDSGSGIATKIALVREAVRSCAEDYTADQRKALAEQIERFLSDPPHRGDSDMLQLRKVLFPETRSSTTACVPSKSTRRRRAA